MNFLARYFFVTFLTAVVILGLTSVSAFSKTELGLHEAAGEGDLVTLQKRIEKGADVNGRDKDCFTPLMIAVTAGQVEAMKLLLSKGANANAKIETGKYQGTTALILAVLEKRTEAAQILIDKGADRTNIEKDVADLKAKWEKLQSASDSSPDGARMNLAGALKDAYVFAQAYFSDHPKSIITTQAQLAEIGWRAFSNDIIFVRADLSTTYGGIVLRNNKLDETSSTVAKGLQPGEGMVDFKGEIYVPSLK